MYLYFSFRSILCIDSSEIYVSTVPHAFQVLVSYTARTFSSRSDLAIEYPQACSCSTVSNIAMRVSYLCWRRHRIVLPLGIDCV